MLWRSVHVSTVYALLLLALLLLSGSERSLWFAKASTAHLGRGENLWRRTGTSRRLLRGPGPALSSASPLPSEVSGGGGNDRAVLPLPERLSARADFEVTRTGQGGARSLQQAGVSDALILQGASVDSGLTVCQDMLDALRLSLQHEREMQMLNQLRVSYYELYQLEALAVSLPLRMQQQWQQKQAEQQAQAGAGAQKPPRSGSSAEDARKGPHKQAAKGPGVRTGAARGKLPVDDPREGQDHSLRVAVRNKAGPTPAAGQGTGSMPNSEPGQLMQVASSTSMQRHRHHRHLQRSTSALQVASHTGQRRLHEAEPTGNQDAGAAAQQRAYDGQQVGHQAPARLLFAPSLGVPPDLLTLRSRLRRRTEHYSNTLRTLASRACPELDLTHLKACLASSVPPARTHIVDAVTLALSRGIASSKVLARPTGSGGVEGWNGALTGAAAGSSAQQQGVSSPKADDAQLVALPAVNSHGPQQLQQQQQSGVAGAMASSLWSPYEDPFIRALRAYQAQQKLREEQERQNGGEDQGNDNNDDQNDSNDNNHSAHEAGQEQQQQEAGTYDGGAVVTVTATNVSQRAAGEGGVVTVATATYNAAASRRLQSDSQQRGQLQQRQRRDLLADDHINAQHQHLHSGSNNGGPGASAGIGAATAGAVVDSSGVAEGLPDAADGVSYPQMSSAVSVGPAEGQSAGAAASAAGAGAGAAGSASQGQQAHVAAAPMAGADSNEAGSAAAAAAAMAAAVAGGGGRSRGGAGSGGVGDTDSGDLDSVLVSSEALVEAVLQTQPPQISFLLQYFKRPWMVPRLVKPLAGCAAALGLSAELLINVDHAQDAELLAQWSKDTGGFVVPVFSANIHETRAYNRLASMARGRLMYLLQDDDVLPGPEVNCRWLANSAAAFAEWPRLGALGMKRFVYDYHPNTSVEFMHFKDRNLDVDLQFVALVDYAPLVVRRSAWRALGGVDENFGERGTCGVHSDYDLCIRMWLGGWQVAFQEIPDIDQDQQEGGTGGTHRKEVAGLCWDKQWELAIGYIHARWGRTVRHPDDYYFAGSALTERMSAHAEALNLLLLHRQTDFCPFGYGCDAHALLRAAVTGDLPNREPILRHEA